MKLVHYSPQLITTLYSPRETDDSRVKPRGFWVSDDGCEDNWRSWCESEQFRIDIMAYAYDIDLNPDINLLTISSANELLDFTRSFLRSPMDPAIDIYAIDWNRVTSEFDGIVISPYQRECRHELMWYYGWDCASGCIWNVDKIRIRGRVEPVLLS